jgi:transcriptional regulator with XRE-family HTH domain
VARARDLSALGEVIRSLRRKRRLSQEGLAHEAGLDRTYIGGIERGERNPSFLSLLRILRALGVGWREFGRRIDSIISVREPSRP